MDWFRNVRRRKLPQVTFSDGCGCVCDDRCRSDRLRAETYDRIVRTGWRVV